MRILGHNFIRRKAFGARLHIGCGDKHLDGWINIDIQHLPGVDVVFDVTRGLGYTEAEAIYSEHFLEHLPLDRSLDFLFECHRALRQSGWMRLSTPNLDWVWATHYALHAEHEGKIRQGIMLNRAFRAWGHQFVWNSEMLGSALEAAGFENLRWCRYGESSLEMFQGIERHETYEDDPDLPHVLIVEAQKGHPSPEKLRELRGMISAEFLDHVAAR